MKKQKASNAFCYIIIPLFNRFFVMKLLLNCFADYLKITLVVKYITFFNYREFIKIVGLSSKLVILLRVSLYKIIYELSQ